MYNKKFITHKIFILVINKNKDGNDMLDLIQHSLLLIWSCVLCTSFPINTARWYIQNIFQTWLLTTSTSVCWNPIATLETYARSLRLVRANVAGYVSDTDVTYAKMERKVKFRKHEKSRQMEERENKKWAKSKW